MMRTTLDIPENLLSEAMRITRTKTKTAVIILALEELIRKERISELKQFKGKIGLDIGLDNLRARR
ncbi:type II toxin-antitoxin system VapB family antitoxin [Nitrosomonas sp. wSCUT-2]